MRVKYCGITRLEDAEQAIRVGGWAIGLQHWPESPRRVDVATATAISAAVRRRIVVVGVFVNATLEELVRAAEDESLAMLQLHGDEGPDFCREVARRTGCKVIKALRVRSAADVQTAQAFRTDYHLFDAHHPARPGGTGESFDWELLAARHSGVPMILAGGLRPDNVGGAIAIASPYAVDVASGIESEPGVKDHELMSAFAKAAGVPSEALAR